MTSTHYQQNLTKENSEQCISERKNTISEGLRFKIVSQESKIFVHNVKKYRPSKTIILCHICGVKKIKVHIKF